MESDPEEPGEFSGHGDDRLLGWFSPGDQGDVASMETLGRSVSQVDHALGLSFASSPQGETDGGPVPMVIV